MPPSYEATVVGASAAWRELYDRLNSGMCHELNGRFSAFSSLLQIVAMKGEVESVMLTEIERETDRLGEALELLRTIPGFGRSPGEVVALHELVPRLIRLSAMERGVHSIEFEASIESDVGVVRTDLNTLSQCLLIVFASAARDAQILGERRVCAEVSSRNADVEISVGVPVAPTEEAVEPWIEAKELLPRIADDGLEAVRSSIEATGASLGLYGDTDRYAKSYIISFPSGRDST